MKLKLHFTMLTVALMFFTANLLIASPAMDGSAGANSTDPADNPVDSQIEKTTETSRDHQCGEPLIDPRDGQSYATVQIGDQCWMAENLNFGNVIPLEDDMLNNGIPEKYCYDNNPANCDTYGALYQWTEVMQYTTTEGIQGLCPDGWHMPTDDEWCLLELSIDPTVNCGAWFWRGTDGGTKLKEGGSSGFEALFGGYIFSNMSSLQMGDFGYFWTSTTYNDTRAIFRAVGDDFETIRRFYNYDYYGQSVRCIKGEGAENFPPDPPVNPTPSNGATNQLIGVDLMWECTDPEGDPLTFDVYMGTGNNPPLVASGVSGVTYNPGALQYLTTYYWKIFAHDSQGNTTEGPVWSFTTQPQSGFFTCGQVFTDPRNGQQYNTIKIGEVCWMAENLNIGERIDLSTQQSDNELIEKYCYDNNPTNCDNFGGLYQWDEMMQYSTVQGSKGICPDGWRLPTDNEWKVLEGNADSQFPVGDPEWDGTGFRGSDVGGNLKQLGTSNWQSPNAGATNSSGFTALPGGYAAGTSFNSKGQMAWFWTSTQETGSTAISRYLHYGTTTSNRSDFTKVVGTSVRCIQGNVTPNEPPSTPSNPSPANGATGQALEPDLSWVSTDPDGDPVTFDVYFGAQQNPPLVAEGIDQSSYLPGMLDYNTTYYWKIVAHDDHSNSTDGPVWSFTTTPLYYTVTFFIEDESGIPLSDAVITLGNVTNAPNDYIFDEVEEGTYSYMVELENYITISGEVTVTDQNVEVTVAMPVLVVVEVFPFDEDFSAGELPVGWQNKKIMGDYGWEFALTPFPHAFIHNIARPQVNANLITPLLDAADLGQVKLGINQRFMMDGSGGTVSILASEDNLTWETIEQYNASIGTGDDFEYIEYNLDQYAGKAFFIALSADFPDTDASYEAVWEVESLNVYEPAYTVTFEVADTTGNLINNAVITLDGNTNPAGDYVFENISAGTYSYDIKADGYIAHHGFVTLVDENITETVALRDVVIITEFPYVQDFEENILPEGWNSITLGDPDGYWRFSEGQAQIMSGWGNRTHALLVSPAFDCSDLEAVAIGLNHYYSDIFGEGFAEIVVSTDGETWQTVKRFQDETVGNTSFPYFEYYATEFAAGHENVHIGLLYDDLAETEFWWLIDAFTVFEPEPYAVSVNNLTGNKYVDEGDAFTYEFEVVNMGAENDTYNLEVPNATWDVVLSQQTITINAGQRDTVSVTVTVPAAVEMGEENEMTLSATSQGDISVSAGAAFITVAVSTIKAYYFEDFDLAEVPALPGGWSKIVQSTAYWSRVQTVKSQGIAPASPPNNAEIYVADDPNANLIMISPMIDESVDLKDFRILFKLRTGTNAAVKLGTMTSPTGTFTELETYITPEHFTWEYFMYSFADYQGSDRYIAFKLDVLQTSRGISLDDITIEIIPPPILRVTPESHDFGEYWEQYPSEVPLAMDIRNVGHDSVFVQSITLDNTDDFFLDIQGGLPIPLFWNQYIPVDVYFNASSEGPKSGNVIIEYNDGTPKTMEIPLEGIGIPRPQGSTCGDPINLQLPVVDYEGSTIEHGDDFGINWVNPGTYFLGGYDMVFSFSLEEESYLHGSIEGPYYGPGLQIVNACPHPDDRPVVLARAEGMYGGSFEHIIIPAGDYFAIVGSREAGSSWPYYTEFILNLSAEPTPDLHAVTFNLIEDSPEQLPVEGVDVSITGFQTNLGLISNIAGQVNRNLYEGEYHVYIYKKDYETHTFNFFPTSDTVVDILMKDLIWTPHSLNVETAGLYPGQAHFTWIPKPQGDPWNEGFEGSYPPNNWDTIVTNNGQVEEPGYDWKFTWQKYGPVVFMDMTATPVEGDYQAFVHWSVEPQDEWLITHEFEAPAGNLEFWYHGPNGAPFGDYFVKVSNDGGDTWFDAWNASDLPSGRNNYDYPALVDLQPWAGQNIRIAWNVYGPDYGIYGAWCIDKISVGEMRINPEDLIYVSKTEKPPTGNHTGTISSTRDGAVLPRVTFEDMNYDLTGNRYNQGFSIYLDDLENPVATGVQDPEFMFTGLDAGDYVAGVQAVYSTGQSDVVTIPFNNPASGQEYAVSFTVEDEGGIPVNGAAIDVIYAGNVLHTLVTQNGMADVQLYPGDYDFIVAKENFKTYFGTFSVANAPVDVEVVLEEGYQIEFLVKNSADMPVPNATVYIDGTSKTTSVDGTAMFELVPGEYPYSVSHPEYDVVLSSVLVSASQTINVIMNDLTCEKPQELNAFLLHGDAILQWEAPEPGVNGEWAHWDGPHANNSIGSGGAMDLEIAQRFNTFDVRDYDGDFLTRIMFVPHEELCTYSVRVWLGGNANNPGTLVVDQVVLNHVVGEWNEVFLNTPVPIDDSQELWFGLRINTTTGYPAGRDIGPAIDGKGNMVRLPGSNWQTLLQVNPNLDYNWSVRALMEAPDGALAGQLPALSDEALSGFSGELTTTNNPFDRTLSEPRVLLGYNVYRNDELINPGTVTILGYIDEAPPTGMLNYNVTALWSNGCESEFSETATVNNITQQFTFTEGWNSMSAFVVPANPDVETLFVPVIDNLTIMLGLNGIYWPGQGVNTIGDFDNTTGYALKFNSGVDLTINGSELAPTDITLAEGWNFLPVLSSCEVSTSALTESVIEDIVIIQDMIGTEVYWPEMEIYSLEELTPGKAYKIKTVNSISLSFPDCEGKAYTQHSKTVNMISTPWGELHLTPQSQTVVFKNEAMELFTKGDVIGAFGVDDELFGYMQVHGNGHNHAITLFGDATYGGLKDGFTDGEPVTYKLYRTSTGEEFNLEVEYDQTMNATGNYHSGSFAAVINASLLATGVEEISLALFSMYPNPASDEVYFSFDGAADESVTVLIFDAKGQVVSSEVFIRSTRLNTGSMDAGVYFVKISTPSHTEMKKLIIK